ncbi:MAG: hypothetical protein Q7P63_01105 [Verrucomicrobiota bacterium JB022]|nr:hypothetical protein [Verrucomicrobiota bacterium JB022]
MLGTLVRAGHDPDRVLDYPIDKIELLYREIVADRYRQIVIEMDAFRSAEASVHGGKKGHQSYREFRRHLKKASRRD